MTPMEARVAEIAHGLHELRQGSWRSFASELDLSEAELSFRVKPTGDSAVVVDVLVVLARGGEAVRLEESSVFPADKSPAEVSGTVFRKLSRLAQTTELPEPDEADEDEEEDDQTDEEYAPMVHDDRTFEIQSEAIKVELARRLAMDVVDALEKTKRARPDLQTKLGVCSGPGSDGDEAWIEVIVSRRSIRGGVDPVHVFLIPGFPPSEIDRQIQEAIEEYDANLAGLKQDLNMEGGDR